MNAHDESAIREFLAPLRGVPPVTRRLEAQHTRRRGAEVVALAAIGVGVFAMVGLIAFLAHGRSTQPPHRVSHHPSKPNQFAHLRGWIAFEGSPVTMIDPSHPGHVAELHPRFVDAMPLSWSRDGNELLVLRGRHQHLAVVRADGTSVEVPGGSAWAGSLTPDGRSVVYVRGGHVVKASLDGGAPRVLDHDGPHVTDLFGAFTGGQLSPDGSTIALLRSTTGVPAQSGLTVMNSDGADPHRIVSLRRVAALTGYRNLELVVLLAWFPNSDSMLVQTFNQSTTECQVLSVSREGRDLQRWGPPGFCPMRGSADPSGNYFVFTGVRRGYLTITDLAGHVIRYLPLPGEDPGDPTTAVWAPTPADRVAASLDLTTHPQDAAGGSSG